jgi:hypothetical protein
MSAALQLPTIWGAGSAPAERGEERRNWKSPATRPSLNRPESPAEHLPVSVAFYRKHTESMLRRYLYASMQIGRAPSILSDSVGRGWASSRPIRTFEDAVIFVLDMERCLNRLGSLERQILGRIVQLQIPGSAGPVDRKAARDGLADLTALMLTSHKRPAKRGA